MRLGLSQLGLGGQVVGGVSDPYRGPGEPAITTPTPAPSPAALFASSEVGDWWDPSDATKVFTDSAMTTAAVAANGDPLGGLRGGQNAKPLTQATAGLRPVLGVASDGKTFISFDGVDDYLVNTSPWLYAAGAATVVFGIEAEPQASGQVIVDENRSSSGNPAYGIARTYSVVNTQIDNLTFFVRTDANTTIQSSAARGAAIDASRHVVAVIDNGGSVTVRIDGRVVSTFSYTRGTLTLDRFSVGARVANTISSYFKGKVFALIARGANTTGTALANAEAWVAEKTGVTLPYATYDFRTAAPVEILADPAWSGADKAPYWPAAMVKGVPGGLPADFPVDIMTPYTTDHSATKGGMSWLLGKYDAGQPTKIDWKEYDAAMAAGWLDSYAGAKAAASPIVQPALDWQMETAAVWYDAASNTWIMYYQVDTPAPGYWGIQGTCKIESSSPFSWPAPNNTIVLRAPKEELIGLGHTGYFDFVPNPFGGAFPYAYYGVSLCGGGTTGVSAVWGANSPAGPWTFYKPVADWRGRAHKRTGTTTYRASFTQIDLRSIRLHPQGYTFLSVSGVPQAGTEVTVQRTFEYLIDGPELGLLAEPHEVLAPVPATFCSTAARQPSIWTDLPNNRRACVFFGQTDTVNSFGFAESELRNPGNTRFTPLAPVIPAITINETYDFTSMGALPGTLTEALSAFGSSSLSASGRQIDVTGATDYTTMHEAIFRTGGLVPNDYSFMEILVEEEETLLTDNYAAMRIGFSKNKTTSLSDMLCIRSSTASQLLNWQVNQGGSTIASTGGIDNIQGHDYGAGEGGRKWSYGVRYWPKANLLALVSYGCESETFVHPAAYDKSVAHYPFVGHFGKDDGTAIRNRMKRMKVRAG